MGHRSPAPRCCDRLYVSAGRPPSPCPSRRGVCDRGKSVENPVVSTTDPARPRPGSDGPALRGTAPTNGVEYDASAIQVLEGLEAVRKRPGMYIGSTGERGLHHLIWEIVDNAVDEALAGHCDRIVVTLMADGAIRVEDNGRGIPTDTAPGQEMPAVTMALTMLHAGGKFGGGGYKVSGGLHGVGVSVVNALSSHLIVDVKNRGHLWRQSFTIGVPDGELEQVRADGARRGHRHHGHLLGLGGDLRDHDLLPRDHLQPVPRVRLPQQGPRDRGARRAARGQRDRRRRRGRHRQQRDRPGQRGRDPQGRGRRPGAGLQVRPRAWSTTSSTSTGASRRPTPRSSPSRPRRPTRSRTT